MHNKHLQILTTSCILVAPRPGADSRQGMPLDEVGYIGSYAEIKIENSSTWVTWPTAMTGRQSDIGVNFESCHIAIFLLFS
jgi:hypothetical protein